MIKLIIGKKGSGKTKRIVKLAQDALLQATGQVVFIDDDRRCMSELNYKIRFIHTKEYELETGEELYGFIAGMVAGNYDTQKVFIDGLYKISTLNNETVLPFLRKLDALSQKNDIDFFIVVSATSDELPEEARKYVFEELAKEQ